MTTNYPGGTTPSGPVGPGNVPPNDAAWGCVWWWWLLIIIILILIIWWAGWGWGPYGGYWYRRGGPTTAPPTNTNAPAPANRGRENVPGGTGSGTATQPTSQPGIVLPSGLLLRF